MIVKQPPPSKITNIFFMISVILSVIALSVYFYISLSRINYPYELEWMEGASVDTVARILRGDLLYTAPTIDYIAPIYGPAYFYTGALFSAIFGTNLFALRMISFLSILGIFGLIYLWARREQVHKPFAFLGVGLFAASYGALGHWFDLARVDSIYLLFVLLGSYFIRFHTQTRDLLLSAVFFAFATFIKINAVMIFGFLFAYALLTYGKKTWIWVLSLALIGAVTTGIFSLFFGEWFLYWVMARSQDAITSALDWSIFWIEDLPRLWLLLILSIFALYQFMRTRKIKLFRFYIYWTLGIFISAWLSRMHFGGYVNVNMPAYAVLCIVGMMGLQHLVQKASSSSSQWQRYIPIGLGLVVALQFISLSYDVAEQIPTEADRLAGDHFIQQLSEVEGTVMFFAHGYYPQLAGVDGAESGWLMNMVDGDRTGERGLFDENVREALEQQRYAVIITDNAPFLHQHYEDTLETYYEPQPVEIEGYDFVPVTGMQTRPFLWWTPRNR